MARKKYTIDKSGFVRFLTKFKAWKGRRPQEVAQALSAGAELVIRRAQTHYLTGASLKVRSGRLRSSLRKEPASGATVEGNKMYVKVGSNVLYGKAWELGYRVPATVIEPKSKRALSFFHKRAGMQVVVRRVYRPAYHVDARPWLAPAAADSVPAIRKLLERVGVKF